MPSWMHDIDQENWDEISGELMKLHDMSDSDPVKIIDIGCGDGALLKHNPLYWFRKKAKQTRWVFADNSLNALKKCEKTAKHIFCDLDPEENVWTTELLDVNNEAMWANMFRKHKISDEGPFDVAVCHGVTVHVDILEDFLYRVFQFARYAVVEFLDQESRLARMMADDDFVKHGFAYNLWNENMIKRAYDSETHDLILWTNTEVSHILTFGERNGD
jgi:hypothetical protein